MTRWRFAMGSVRPFWTPQRPLPSWSASKRTARRTWRTSCRAGSHVRVGVRAALRVALQAQVHNEGLTRLWRTRVAATGIPPKLEQSLQQGGAFVFRGSEALLQHYDEGTGAHVELAALLSAAGVAPQRKLE
jgi:hypothetical protein